jgi:predicted PurR-regulated permease PerM
MRIENAFRAGLIGSLGVGVGILLMTAIGSLATILTYIGVAFFLALGLDPAVNWLVKKKLPRWGSILTVVLVFIGVVLAITFTLVPVVVDQIAEFVKTFPAFLQQFTTQPWVVSLANQFGSLFDLKALTASLSKFISDPTQIGNVAGGVLKIGEGILAGITGTIVVIILTLFFTASLQTIKETAYSLVPASQRETFARMSEEITGGVGKYIIGQIELALLNGFLAFLMITIAGGKAALMFGFIAFLLALIPLIGTVLSAVIVSLGQLILVSPTVALISIIYFLVYMQIEAYVLSPRIMTKAVAIPGSIVVIAALAGGTLMGILGALVAIPIAASIVLIIKQIVVPAQNKV